MSGVIAQNTLLGSGLIKSPAAAGGAWTVIKKITASGSSTISFVNGTSDVVLDSTYKMYAVNVINAHMSADQTNLQWNMSDDTGSSYNVTKTTVAYDTYQAEAGGGGVGYNASADKNAGSGAIPLTFEVDLGADADQCVSGIMYLYAPASTTFVKFFTWYGNFSGYANYTVQTYVSGYGNTTSAVDAIQFSPTSGNIDVGEFTLLGLTT